MRLKARLDAVENSIPRAREKMEFIVNYCCPHGCTHEEHPSGPVVEKDEEFFKLVIVYPDKNEIPVAGSG